MTGNIPGSDLRELLTDAVSDVEPAHRLSEIRARTARPDRRPRWYVAGSAVLATAAAVTTFAVVTNLDDNDATDPDPAPTGPPTAIETHAVPAYYVGETPHGSRLFREFTNVDVSIPKLEASLDLIEGGAADPDYATYWAPNSFAGASVQGDVIYVDLADEALHDRPAGVSKAEAGLAIEQVIYTLQGALQERLPVQFRINGNPTNNVYGEETSNPLAESPQLDVLALVSITDPAENAIVSGSFTARGVASSFEAAVPWQIQDSQGAVVLEYSAQAAGWEGRLYPWETVIDISRLDPGTYLFVASTDDPTGGTEGPGATSDTRTIVVE